MPDGEYRIFLSAVSSEFRSARNELTDDFGARDVLVRVQERVLPRPPPAHAAGGAATSTIQRLHDGDLRDRQPQRRLPHAGEAAPFAHILPNGVTQASYTQWEYFLARHYDKECLLISHEDAYQPDEPAPPATTSRTCSVTSSSASRTLTDCTMRASPRSIPARVAESAASAGRSAARPSAATHKPIVLPYPSIGPLFKGRDAFLRRTSTNSLARPQQRRALHGMGGVGKTRAAVEYAWTHRAELYRRCSCWRPTPGRSCSPASPAWSTPLLPSARRTGRAGGCAVEACWPG